MENRCFGPIPSPARHGMSALEFYSIKVPDGPLTSRLQLIEPDDRIIMRPKPTGTLVLDALLPGNRLYMFATGPALHLSLH